MGLILRLLAKFICCGHRREQQVDCNACSELLGAVHDIDYNGSVIDQLQAMVGGAGCISARGC